MGGLSISDRYNNPNRLFTGLFLIIIGCIIFTALMLFQGGLLIGFSLLSAGMLFTGLGLIEVILTLHGLDKLEEDIEVSVVPAFIVKKYVMFRDNTIKFLRLFKRDKHGIGWQLAVFTASIPACIFAWFVAAWPTDVIWTAVTGLVTFTGPEASAVNLVREIIALLVGAAVFFSIIWLWVNAHRSEVHYA